MTNLLCVLIWTTNWITVPDHKLEMNGTNYMHAYRVVKVQTNQDEVVPVTVLKTNHVSFGSIYVVSSNSVPEWIPSTTPVQIPPLPTLPNVSHGIIHPVDNQ